MDISDAVEEYLAAKQNAITHKTYAWYDHFLYTFVDWCNAQTPPINNLADIKPAHIQAFVSAAATANTYTRHHRAQIVKGFLRWCSEDEDLGVRRKMVDRIEMPLVEQSDIEIFTPQDIKSLFSACDVMKQPHRNRAIVHTLLDTGMRASEICYDSRRPQEETGLRMDNLFLGRGTESYVWVMGKGRKSRTIGIGQQTSLALRKYLHRERGHAASSFVFLSSHGNEEPLSVRMLQQFLDELGQLARVPDTHPHRFRHTFAVNQLLAGTSDMVLMRLMGHTTLDSTKIYTRAMSQLQARQSAISVVDMMKWSKK